MYNIFEYPDGKTNYQIIDENNLKTTITLDKWVADILQESLPDVHQTIQKLYDNAYKKYPNIGRKSRGNLIRNYMLREAEKHQDIKKKTLGWNNDDISEALNLL